MLLDACRYVLQINHNDGVRLAIRGGNHTLSGCAGSVDEYRKACRSDRGPFSIQPTNSLVRMVVKTNGCGVDVEVVRLPDVSAGCLGLSGMQERAVIVSGTHMIESARGRETTICVDVPMALETPP